PAAGQPDIVDQAQVDDVDADLRVDDLVQQFRSSAGLAFPSARDIRSSGAHPAPRPGFSALPLVTSLSLLLSLFHIHYKNNYAQRMLPASRPPRSPAGAAVGGVATASGQPDAGNNAARALMPVSAPNTASPRGCGR